MLSAASWAYIFAQRQQLGGISGEAYAFGVGSHVFANLLTYTRWSADVFRIGGSGASLLGNAIALLVMLAIVAHAIRSRSATGLAGLTLWAVCLLPVLPLRHQVYEHYLYVSLVGFAIAAGGAAMALVRRLMPTIASRAEWLVVLALVLVQGVTTEASYQRRLDTRIAGLGLPLDSMLRKMQVAANAQSDLAASLPAGATRLVIFSPPGMASTYSVRTGEQVEAAPTGAPAYNMLAVVLDDGRALRALFPQLREARLAEHLLPTDTATVIAANRVGGHLVVFGEGAQAHRALARYWASVGLVQPARLHLAEAAALYPGAPELAPYVGATNAP